MGSGGLVGGHPGVTQAPQPFWHARLGQPWWCRRRFVHGAHSDVGVPVRLDDAGSAIPLRASWLHAGGKGEE